MLFECYLSCHPLLLTHYMVKADAHIVLGIESSLITWNHVGVNENCESALGIYVFVLSLTKRL